MATLEELKKLLESHKNDIISQINSKIDKLIADVDQIRDIAHMAETKATRNVTEIEDLKSEIYSLRDSNKALEDSLEDQINRGLRSTLIFKGIKEEHNESWEQTEEHLINVITRHTKLHRDAVEPMIERAHRGKSSNPKGPRHIYVKFHSWKDSEQVKYEFIELQKKHPKIGVRVEQMFPTKPTTRRNTALLERKSLLENKSIASGFLKYPAVLMIKKDKGDKNYTLYKSY